MLLPYAETAQFATLNVLEKVLLLYSLKRAAESCAVEGGKSLQAKLQQLASGMRDAAAKMKDDQRNAVIDSILNMQPVQVLEQEYEDVRMMTEEA